MAWFKRDRKPIAATKQKASRVPEGLWVKCTGCAQVIYNKDLATNLNVCSKCGYHFRIGAVERLRTLFDMLETKESMLRLLDATREGEGVQIFIGSDNPLFGVAGCSMIVAPYANSREQVVGAIGVIGPTRINYARIIPLVDYTAKVIGRLLG